VRGAQQQTNAKALLDLRDRFRNRRLADAKLPRRTGERAGLDDADERLHGGQAIHGYSPME